MTKLVGGPLIDYFGPIVIGGGVVHMCPDSAAKIEPPLRIGRLWRATAYGQFNCTVNTGCSIKPRWKNADGDFNIGFLGCNPRTDSPNFWRLELFYQTILMPGQLATEANMGVRVVGSLSVGDTGDSNVALCNYHFETPIDYTKEAVLSPTIQCDDEAATFTTAMYALEELNGID